ncbi:MAG: cupin domain-containing protein, partial [Pseudomonadota bacterium]|nr:cupin domain-containing protein [Pseudomonadota bacterium]
MPKINLEDVPVGLRQGYPAEFRDATKGYEQQRVGDAAGLTKMGINRVVLPPRSGTSLMHWHEVDDEFVIIMQGEVVLCEETGETVLRGGDCAGFKAGVANGHSLQNRSDTPAVL